MSEYGMWIERYRPKSLDEFVCSEELRQTFQAWIEDGECPHLLLVGGYGSGKTSLGLLLGRELNAELMELNASDDRSIELVRNTITRFAMVVSILGRSLKIVLLDEFDDVPKIFSNALRRLMEKYSKGTRFIFTCNALAGVDNGIISRCVTVTLWDQPKEELEKAIEKRAKEILRSEKVKFSPDDLRRVIREGYSSEYDYYDIRKIINDLQRYSRDSRLQVN